jgi:hypothetical protein
MTQTGGYIPAAVGFIKFCPRPGTSRVSEACGTFLLAEHCKQRVPHGSATLAVRCWRQALKLDLNLPVRLRGMRGKCGAGSTADIHGLNGTLPQNAWQSVLGSISTKSRRSLCEISYSTPRKNLTLDRSTVRCILTYPEMEKGN